MKIRCLSVIAIALAVGACASTEGTNPYVDERIKTLKNEVSTAKDVQDRRKKTLNEMREHVVKSNGKYKDTVNKIQFSLSSGVEPANKDLIDQWKDARMQLEKNNDIAFDMRMLVAQLEKDVKILDYIDESVKGMDKIPGKTRNEQTELNQVLSDTAFLKKDVMALIKSTEDEADSSTVAVLNEKENLNDLALSIKEGRVVGMSNSSSMYSSHNMNGNNINAKSLDQKLVNGGRALIDIDMSKNTDCSEPLYHSLSRALERDPSTSFQVVSIASNMSVAKKNSEKVISVLTEMGMPASRISIKSHTIITGNPQVSIYTR